MASVPFALQLYTVRDHMEKDAPGTLKRVKEIGYDYVETAGFAGRSPAEFKNLLDAAGITSVSAHAGYDAITERTSEVIATVETLGVKYAVLSSAADNKAGWLEVAANLDAAGAALRKQGIQLCYHNHAHEFVRYDGEYALDILLAATRPENVACEIDAYWVQHGGENPVAVIEKYAGRCPLLHIKDMTPDDASKPEPHTFAEVGQGVIDWRPIFAAGENVGVKWYIVEQDTCEEDSLKSAEISAKFMMKQ
jgi:sugar phosphate isomerase/epimerase